MPLEKQWNNTESNDTTIMEAKPISAKRQAL